MAFGTTASLSILNTNDTTFQTWIQAIHAIILAMGFVDNGDAGQLNLATAVRSASANTSSGYRIYKSVATGGLLDVTLKLEFGTGSSQTVPAFWWSFTFGGSDGNGTLLGNAVARRQVTTSVTAGRLDWSGDANGRCIFNCQTSSNYFGFSMERTRNPDLSFRNEIQSWGFYGTTRLPTQVANTTTVFPVDTNDYGKIQPDWSSSPIGGVAALGIRCGLAPGPTSPMMNSLFAETNGVGVNGDVLPIPVYGTNRNYKIQHDGHSLTTTNTSMLMLYE